MYNVVELVNGASVINKATLSSFQRQIWYKDNKMHISCNLAKHILTWKNISITGKFQFKKNYIYILFVCRYWFSAKVNREKIQTLMKNYFEKTVYIFIMQIKFLYCDANERIWSNILDFFYILRGKYFPLTAKQDTSLCPNSSRLKALVSNVHTSKCQFLQKKGSISRFCCPVIM